MALKRRKVIDGVCQKPPKGTWQWKLKLECGHTVTRSDRGRRKAPETIACDQCEMLLDRLEARRTPETPKGWAFGSDLKATRHQLAFLESEGYVESSQSGHNVRCYARTSKERP